MVGYLGHFDMFLARPLASIRRKPLFFDAFLSLYDTVVMDRKLLKPESLPARFLFWMDRTACLLADRVVLDTRAHIDFFVETFHLSEKKFRRVFVGAETGLFHPCGAEPESISGKSSFRVLFYGQFIPLHGIDVIVRAAKILEGEDVEFTLIGKGQEYSRIRALADHLGVSNIRWIEWVPYEDIRSYICGSHAGLGIFGDTEKAGRVIPNKAFQILACRRPLITGDSPAIRELLVNRATVILCKRGMPEDLAEAILLLKTDSELRHAVSEGGCRAFHERCRVDPETFLLSGGKDEI
jgi:glycosyltransferase involved in cell wall biosynthesis